MDYILIFLTFGVFFLAKWLQKVTHSPLLNPMLVTIIVLIVVLSVSGVGYGPYSKAAAFIDFWMKPVIVALAVPLYQQVQAIRSQWFPVVMSQLVACVVGVTSVVLLARLMGATQEVALSLSPKSATMPIALEVSKAIGGIPSLTAAAVCVAGISGAICAYQICRLFRITRSESQGLAIGAASHAIGTSAALERDPKIGAFSSLGLTLNGIFTALLTPAVTGLIY